jgi:hypothetical protein
MKGAVGVIIKTCRIHMQVVFTIGSRVSEAIVEADALPIPGIPVPDALVVIAHAVLCIKYRHAIAPDTDVAHGSGDSCGGVLLRISGDLEQKILIYRGVGVGCPGSNGIIRNAGSGYIYIIG